MSTFPTFKHRKGPRTICACMQTAQSTKCGSSDALVELSSRAPHPQNHPRTSGGRCTRARTLDARIRQDKTLTESNYNVNGALYLHDQSMSFFILLGALNVSLPRHRFKSLCTEQLGEMGWKLKMIFSFLHRIRGGDARPG